MHNWTKVPKKQYCFIRLRRGMFSHVTDVVKHLCYTGYFKFRSNTVFSVFAQCYTCYVRDINILLRFC